MTTPPYHKLLCAAVANSTHAAYTTAYNRFEHWIQRPISSLPNPDVTLSEYFAHLESSGESQHTARKTLYALLHFHPHLAGRLPTAHRCLRGFSNLRPTGVQHPPLPWHIAHGVAFVLASQGVPAAAIAVLLSHHTLLRISEVVAIRAGDFRYTHTPATPPSPTPARPSPSSNENGFKPELSHYGYRCVPACTNLVCQQGTER